MLNLTSGPITILRQDDSRVHLPAATVVPRLVLKKEGGVVYQGALKVIVPPIYEVDFTGVDLTSRRSPLVVNRDIFDALPDDFEHRVVTPDHDTCIRNGLNVPHLIRQFIGKPSFTVNPRPESTDSTTNNQ